MKKIVATMFLIAFLVLVFGAPIRMFCQTFSFTPVHLEDSGKPGDRLACKAEVKNLTGQTINVTINRYRNDLAEGWSSSFCLNQCYAPFTDNAKEDIPANTTMVFTMYYDTITDSAGHGECDVRLSNTANLNENYSLTFKATTLKTTFIAKPGKAVQFELKQNYPNPFGVSSVAGSSSTTIQFSIPKSSDVSVKIYDMLGREVKMLVNAALAPGIYSELWTGRDNNGQLLPTGVYIYKLQAGKYSETKRIIYLR